MAIQAGVAAQGANKPPGLQPLAERRSDRGFVMCRTQSFGVVSSFGHLDESTFGAANADLSARTADSITGALASRASLSRICISARTG